MWAREPPDLHLAGFFCLAWQTDSFMALKSVFSGQERTSAGDFGFEGNTRNTVNGQGRKSLWEHKHRGRNAVLLVWTFVPLQEAACFSLPQAVQGSFKHLKCVQKPRGISGVCSSLPQTRSQLHPKRSWLLSAKQCSTRRRLTNDLCALGETPLFFLSPQIHVLRCCFWPLLCRLLGFSRITGFHGNVLFMFRWTALPCL